MKLLIVLMCICLPLLSVAQNKHIIDSLQHVLDTAKSDITKAKAYNRLSGRYSEADVEKAMQYADKALALSRKIKFKEGEADATFNRGQVFFNTLKLDSAKNTFNTSIKLHTEINDETGLADDYISLGCLIRNQGRSADAVTYFQKATDIFERTKNLRGQAKCLVMLANNFNKMLVFDKALTMYKKAYALRVTIKDTILQAQTLVGIAITYRNKQLYNKSEADFKQAVYYFLKGRDVFVKAGDKLATALTDRETGMIYLFNNKYKEALVYLLESASIMETLKYKREFGLLYKTIGTAYLQTGQYPKAKIAFEKGLKYSLAENFQEHITEGYEGLYHYYKAVKNDKMSLLYHEKWMESKDSLTTKFNFDKLSEMTAKYETEKKEQQINILNKENTIQKLSISGRNKTIGIIIGLFVLAAIFGGLFYNRNKLKQRAELQQQMMKQQEILTQAVIEAEEKERKRIASDLHDGVGQLFSAVKMNLNGLLHRVKMDRDEDRYLAEQTLALVDESCKEVRIISHQMMPNMLLRSGIASDVKSFIEKIDSESLKVTVETNGFKNHIESNVETVLYRVIQETVNNVIKHSKASKLDIILNREGDGINALVADNGVGFDASLKDDFAGIGLKNISARIEYLKGTVVYDSAPGKGTRVKIWVPVA